MWQAYEKGAISYTIMDQCIHRQDQRRSAVNNKNWMQNLKMEMIGCNCTKRSLGDWKVWKYDKAFWPHSSNHTLKNLM